MTELTLDSGNRYRLLRVAMERFSCEPSALTPEQRQEAERIVARQLRIEEAVLRSIEAAGVVVPDAQVEEAFRSIAGRYEDPAAFLSALQGQALDEEGVRGYLARDLAVEAVLERVCRDLQPVSDDMVQQYYQNNLSQFCRPESRRARHILVTINPDYPENTREEAQARIESIRQRLLDGSSRADTGHFARQAAKYSECPSAMEGGLLGEVTRGKLYPELEEVLFLLGSGQISDVVESPLGFHLLYCETHTPEERASLEEATPKLRDWLDSKARQQRQKEWLTGQLQKQAAGGPAHD